MTVTPEQLEGLTTADLADEMRSGGQAATEVTEAYLTRIQRLNPELGAYITVCGAAAIMAATAAERMKPAERAEKPLFGVPFGVKDQLLSAGVRTTAGSKVMREFVPDRDATVVAQLQDAGAILLGKLNMT